MKPSVEYSGRTGPCGFFFILPHHPQLQQSLISPARLSQLLPGCATESSRISPRGRSGGGGVSGDGKWSVRLTLFRREAAGIRDGTLRSTSRIGMSCPYCSSVDCCRSVRHDGQDFLHLLLGRFPWRCNVAGSDFICGTGPVGDDRLTRPLLGTGVWGRGSSQTYLRLCPCSARRVRSRCTRAEERLCGRSAAGAAVGVAEENPVRPPRNGRIVVSEGGELSVGGIMDLAYTGRSIGGGYA